MISYRLNEKKYQRDIIMEVVMMLAVSGWSVFGQVGLAMTIDITKVLQYIIQ